MVTVGDVGRKLSEPESGFWHWGWKTRMGLAENS